ncbi:hypothetical protein SAMN05192534_12438 [Alteribacillus persepolensis]|uniref:HTH luxR-type domain-containing protein n=2 Tax=Alteribacillus persepolensis TaxID=568899 RepID=A0A1G8IIB9_9BACI|nr:hypothetical protein SAMN05192534_12438 [Alteribacillus persepolensis]
MRQDIGDNITAMYGLEAAMPKPQGNQSDPILQEYLRREDEWQDIEKLKKKVVFVQERISCIHNDKERAVLNRILDGMSLRAVSRQMGLSHTHVRNIRDSIVSQFTEFPKSANFPKQTGLKKEVSSG